MVTERQKTDKLKANLTLYDRVEQARIEERKAIGERLDNHAVSGGEFLPDWLVKCILALCRGERPEEKNG